jgi:uncharacterized RDD family membrane protein YckC
LATQPAWAGAGVGTAAAQRPAGFWIRVGAYLIDGIIVGAFNSVVTFAITLAAGGSINGLPAFLLFLFDFLVGIAYFSFLWSTRGQSIGMMATGLRVIQTDGTPLTLGRAVARALALALSFAICFVGVIMVAFTQRKQGLHDLICNTLVVHTN